MYTWLTSAGLHTQVWQCVSDGERYVKATALVVMGNMVQWPAVWGDLIKHTVEVTLRGKPHVW